MNKSSIDAHLYDTSKVTSARQLSLLEMNKITLGDRHSVVTPRALEEMVKGQK